MRTVGIICEYNPFHAGHQHQFDAIRQHFGSDCAIVCLMSGYFVQRGAPAIFAPEKRAHAALCAGADLVLEMPVNVSLSSAEGFALGGVEILGSFCDYLCFGTESLSESELVHTAEILRSPAFRQELKAALETGCSFPAARQAALEKMGVTAFSRLPNDTLGLEYVKAMLASETNMKPFPIHRSGSYHSEKPDAAAPSATSLRLLIEKGNPWLPFVPTETASCYQNATVHTLAAGERAILFKLRTMTDEEFEALPFGSEGLWRKLMHNARSAESLEEILTRTKSKRYTRSRLDRMVMCAFLGLNEQAMHTKAPYTRILGMTDRGRQILKDAKQKANFCNVGEPRTESWQAIEELCGDLYGLFCNSFPEAPGAAEKRRVIYLPNE